MRSTKLIARHRRCGKELALPPNSLIDASQYVSYTREFSILSFTLVLLDAGQNARNRRDRAERQQAPRFVESPDNRFRDLLNNEVT